MPKLLSPPPLEDWGVRRILDHANGAFIASWHEAQVITIDGSSDEQELIKNVRDFGPIYKVAIQNLLSRSCLNTAREPRPGTSGIDRVGDSLTL